MISIRADLRALAKVKEKVVVQVNRKYRAHVYKMFDEVLKVGAQFSGDYVSNWKIVVGAPSDTGYRRWPGKDGTDLGGDLKYAGTVHQAGDPEAIDYARQGAARLPFTYKDKVFFVNPTPLSFTGTTVTSDIEGGTKPLRPENIIGGGVLLKSYMRAKFGGRL